MNNSKYYGLGFYNNPTLDTPEIKSIEGELMEIGNRLEQHNARTNVFTEYFVIHSAYNGFGLMQYHLN